MCDSWKLQLWKMYKLIKFECYVFEVRVPAPGAVLDDVVCELGGDAAEGVARRWRGSGCTLQLCRTTATSASCRV